MRIRLVVVLCSSILVFSQYAIPASILAEPISANSISFQKLPYAIELPDVQVNTILQDASGFMWFGTFSGLIRFDGLDFKQYDKSYGLDSNIVTALTLDSNSRIWVGTSRGVSLLDVELGSFQQIELRVNGELVHPWVYDVFEGPQGRVWIGTSEGLFSLFQSNSASWVDFGGSLETGAVRSVVGGSGADAWVGTEKLGVFLIDDNFQVVSHYDQEVLGLGPNGHIRDMLVGDGVLWIGSFGGGLIKLELASGHLTKFGLGLLGTDRIRTLYRMSAGPLLIGSDEGLHLLSESSISSYFADSEFERSLPSNVVHSVFQDDGGVVWVGTFSNLVRFNPLAPNLRLVSLKGLEVDDSVVAFSENSKGQVAIATFSGVALWDLETGGMSDVFRAREISDRVTSVLFDDKDRLWIGTFSKGIYVLVEGKIVDRFVNHPGDTTSIPSNAITFLYLDSNRNVWVSTYGGGVARYESATQSFRQFFDSISHGQRHIDFGVFGLHEDKRGMVWAASTAGLLEINPVTEEERLFDRGSGLTSEDLISVLTIDNMLFVGSFDDGLSVYRRHGQDIELLFDGLSLGSIRKIYGLVKGEDDAIWLSAAQTILRISPDLTSVSQFDRRHGLQASDLNSLAYTSLSTGHLLFGGNVGMTIINPDMPIRNEFKPPLVVTSFKVNHREDMTKAIQINSIIELNHDQDQIEVTFVALDFTMPFSNQYKYKLEGFDENWIENGTSNLANYTNLDPGSYTLRVMGSNSDGVWSDQQLAIPIKIHPAPWATWWAYSLYLAAIAFVFYRMLVFSNQRVGREAEERFNRRLQLYVFSLDGTAECVINAAKDGSIRYCNVAVRRVLGKEPSEILGCSIFDVLIQDKAEAVSAKDQLEEVDNYQQVHEYATSENQIKILESSISRVRLREEDDIAYAAIVRDVTERNRDEAALRHHYQTLQNNEESLKQQLQLNEEEANLREQQILSQLAQVDSQRKNAHDHTSDSLQMLMSLLNIQSSRFSEPEVVRLIQDHRLRLNVLTLVHEHLYASSEDETVNMNSFLNSLAVSLHRQLSPNHLDISLEKDLDEVSLPVQLAVPCGLIANELVCNALIHGYEDKNFGSGNVVVKFHKVAGECILFVSDDGKGLPLAFNVDKSSAVGMEVVSILVGQLDGTIKFVGGSGTSFEVRFPVDI